jgi:hypothetical protein
VSVILVVDWVCLQKIVLSIYLVIGRTRRGKKEELAGEDTVILLGRMHTRYLSGFMESLVFRVILHDSH